MFHNLGQTLNKITNKSSLDFNYTLTTYDDNGVKHTSAQKLDGQIIYDKFSQRHRSKCFMSYNSNDSDIVVFLELWHTFITSNAYNISRQISALFAEFNPISNYDKHSSIANTYGEQNRTKTTGEQSNSSTIGSQNNSSIVGATEVTTTSNEHTDTTNIGEQDNTLVNGEQEQRVITPELHQTTEGATSPYDANLYGANTDKSSTTVDANEVITTSETVENHNIIGEQTNSVEYGEHITSVEGKAQNNSSTIGERSDSSVIGSRTDTETDNEHNDTMTEHTWGNIGVMTSTQAINEILQTYNFNFYDYVVNLFDSEYLMYIDFD